MDALDRELMAWVADARARTLALIEDLSDEKLLGPRLPIVNPPLWEVGHVAWFQEKWVLRGIARRPPILPEADALYDSIAIPHDLRWDLPLPSRAATRALLDATRDAVLERLERGASDEERYFIRLATFHEDMHAEALTYTRQTLGYPAPSFVLDGMPQGAEPLTGDVVIPGGEFLLGATPDEPFVFDNEKWAHPVKLESFAIARAAVTQAEFAAFVDEGGYTRREFWSEDGWSWREAEGAAQPLYWRRVAGGWQRRHFDRWVDLEPERAMVHVSWYEADAYCRWAGRRLPTEAEWEAAAACEPDGHGGRSSRKRRFPWGDEAADSTRANLGWVSDGCAPTSAFARGDSAFGCRQMIGNVWEWTATTFEPYPGFVPDPYKEYSEPWFGTRKVLRGGCWATPPRLLRNTWRNFFTPDRRDIWAGFRTCAR